MKGVPVRSYLNSSKRDYSETRQLNCRACKESFQSTQIFLSGKPIAPLPDLCADCERLLSCTSFPLPSVRKRKPRSECSWVLAPSEAFMQELQGLCSSARSGDDRALWSIVEIAKVSTSLLQDVAADQPERLIPIASRDIVWPAFIGPKAASLRMNKRLIRDLQVGQNAPNRGKWKPDSPSTVAAICMASWLERNRESLGLPPLSRKTQDAWFDVGWRALLLATKGAPELHPYLKTIGRSAIGKRSTTRGMPAQTPGMLRDDVRAKIKGNILESFRSLTGAFP